MFDFFLQMCSNLTIMFLNSFMYFRTVILEIPYYNVFIILLSAIVVFKISIGEINEIKDPYKKAGRRRI